MKKTLGILGLLVVICIFTAVTSDRFLTPFNIENLIRRTSLFGIISIGAAFVIMGRGIDLSIGSVVCLAGILTPYLMNQPGWTRAEPIRILWIIPLSTDHGWAPWVAVPCVLGLACAIGLAHGLLITKLRMQPFIVTLCGLLLYRGLARGLTADQTQGFGGDYGGLKWFASGDIPLPGLSFDLPAPAIILLTVGVVGAVALHLMVFGRYLLAIGHNEEAARYSGVNVDRVKITSYIISSGLAGLGGLLFVLDVGSAQPVDFGNFYELYAIAAAVLGGCSLRGGEGAIIGVIVGAGVMQVLRNTITLTDWIPNNTEYAVIGAVILVGVGTDEALRRLLGERLRRRALERSNSP
ncbi:MAG: ABC transporter permease [Phycisphaerales bacterium JB039]